MLPTSHKGLAAREETRPNYDRAAEQACENLAGGAATDFNIGKDHRTSAVQRARGSLPETWMTSMGSLEPKNAKLGLGVQ